MIGEYVATADVVAALEEVRRHLCSYGPLAQTCDCKFLRHDRPYQSSEETGCCEIRQAIEHIKHLATGDAFHQRLIAVDGQLRRVTELIGGVRREVQTALEHDQGAS